MTLIIFRGLPGCGKSTKAREMQAERGGRVVERDEIRYMLYGRYTNCDEKLVTNVQDRLIEEGLRMGENVFVSDMNLRNAYVTRLIRKAWEFGDEYEIVDMSDVEFDVCVARNNSLVRQVQGKVVPDAVLHTNYNKFIKGKTYPLPVFIDQGVVLEKQWKKYIPDTRKTKTIVVDIDGTVAKMKDRGPFDEHLVGQDDVHEAVIQMVEHAASAEIKIIFMSGRTQGCYEATRAWLIEKMPWLEYDWAGVSWDLFMREVGDQRSDDVVKHEMFHKFVAPGHNVLYVIDDRNKVVKMWREIGLVCAQVAEGDF
jgi:predicted kinase